MNIRQIIKDITIGQGTFVLLLVVVIVGSIIVGNQGQTVAENKETVNVNQEAFEVMAPKTVEVVLERVYLDGEISEEVVQETIWSMEDFWAFYADWTLLDQNESRVTFQQEVNDISPLLKINGYFGISEEGILNIYDGHPNHEKVIQSFFQINTNKLQSHQHHELKEGIPVLSRENFQEVLKTFERYAVKKM
ncbi:intercompartmental signaling factor BofC [Bacillus alkalicellulosilyticus]|uniref:intercompartmental signaling factor BofC n=1 Tax=Alkalihalobacterium alkalicellulosilyticum TaxID=1912214 RepID=UPI000997014D|nr:intercompartmental signaling factor BofC [Bacillus alkalicellulosilyticus]